MGQTEWESETSVRCLVGRGIQGTRRMVVTAGEREGTGSAMYSTDVGSLSACPRAAKRVLQVCEGTLCYPGDRLGTRVFTCCTSPCTHRLFVSAPKR